MNAPVNPIRLLTNAIHALHGELSIGVERLEGRPERSAREAASFEKRLLLRRCLTAERRIPMGKAPEALDDVAVLYGVSDIFVVVGCRLLDRKSLIFHIL